MLSYRQHGEKGNIMKFECEYKHSKGKVCDADENSLNCDDINCEKCFYYSSCINCIHKKICPDYWYLHECKRIKNAPEFNEDDI